MSKKHRKKEFRKALDQYKLDIINHLWRELDDYILTTFEELEKKRKKK